MKGIPVVDIELLKTKTAEASCVKSVSKQLDTAFSSVGFVYLKNHGIEQQVIESVFQFSKKFFQLPEDEKNLVRRPINKNDGYVGLDQEMLSSGSLHELREAYNITSNESLYPDDSVREFRESINCLVPQVLQLTNRILECLAEALGLESTHFLYRHRFMFEGAGRNATTFRTLYYPPLVDSDIDINQANVVRCGAHSDYGTITLLMQDDMGGLEVMSEGEWIPADPIPGTILVNLGDLLQFWTSDRYIATVHRVRVPEEEIRRRSARQSLAFFVHPDNDVLVAPLDGSTKHQPITALEHLKNRLSATYKF